MKHSPRGFNRMFKRSKPTDLFVLNAPCAGFPVGNVGTNFVSSPVYAVGDLTTSEGGDDNHFPFPASMTGLAREQINDWINPNPPSNTALFGYPFFSAGAYGSANRMGNTNLTNYANRRFDWLRLGDYTEIVPGVNEGTITLQWDRPKRDDNNNPIPMYDPSVSDVWGVVGYVVRCTKQCVVYEYARGNDGVIGLPVGIVGLQARFFRTDSILDGDGIPEYAFPGSAINMGDSFRLDVPDNGATSYSVEIPMFDFFPIVIPSTFTNLNTAVANAEIHGEFANFVFGFTFTVQPLFRQTRLNAEQEIVCTQNITGRQWGYGLLINAQDSDSDLFNFTSYPAWIPPDYPNFGADMRPMLFDSTYFTGTTARLATADLLHWNVFVEWDVAGIPDSGWYNQDDLGNDILTVTRANASTIAQNTVIATVPFANNVVASDWELLNYE
jgi:hypothetical protein